MGPKNNLRQTNRDSIISRVRTPCIRFEIYTNEYKTHEDYAEGEQYHCIPPWYRKASITRIGTTQNQVAKLTPSQHHRTSQNRAISITRGITWGGPERGAVLNVGRF